MGSRELKKAATRAALVDAAAELFAQRGVDATTMEDIARAAGTSRTSVFNYFGYKEMILCEIGARYVADLLGTAQSAQSQRRTPRGLLLDLVDTLVAISERDPTLVSAVAHEMMHPDRERRRQANLTMGYGFLIDGILDAFERAGQLRDPRSRPSYGRMILDMTAGALIRVGGDFPRSRLRTELHRNVDVFLSGATGLR